MKLEILFPEICCLFGDTMNVRLIERALPETEVIRTPLRDEPAFATGHVDMIYMGSMTERSQALATAALMPHRDRLIELIDGGTVFLITGNAAELFGQYIENEDGTRLDTLGIFDTHAKRRMMNRFNGLYLGRFGDTPIVGFKSQFSHSYGSADALFETTRGVGRNPETGEEGLRRGNFMASYVLGPLLVLNPLFLRQLLAILGHPDCEIPFEAAAMDAYNLRLQEFSDPKTGFGY